MTNLGERGVVRGAAESRRRRWTKFIARRQKERTRAKATARDWASVVDPEAGAHRVWAGRRQERIGETEQVALRIDENLGCDGTADRLAGVEIGVLGSRPWVGRSLGVEGRFNRGDVEREE